MKKVLCFSCKKITESEHIGFRQDCEHCGADLHICLNCNFYDEKSYNECRETSADRIKIKDRSNLCEYFEAKSDEKAAQSEKDKLLAAAEALFKNNK